MAQFRSECFKFSFSRTDLHAEPFVQLASDGALEGIDSMGQ